MFRLTNKPALTLLVLGALSLSACAKPQVSKGINDPYESHNRSVHEFNRSVDKALLRPASKGYGSIIPKPLARGVGNVAGNLSLPSYILNDVLQGNIQDAGANFFRLMINSTFGLAGLLDPATDMGITERESDFGETLHVWGFAEGHYVELPMLGPSTKRDTIGAVVDFLIDPIGYVIPAPERYIAPIASAAASVGERDRFADTIDSILYDSADSYAQARLLYLESRRFQLGGAQDDSFDGYDDYDNFYGQ